MTSKSYGTFDLSVFALLVPIGFYILILKTLIVIFVQL
jgi:hypothetical protein